MTWNPERGYTVIKTDGPAPNLFFGHCKNFEGLNDESDIKEKLPVEFSYIPDAPVSPTNKPKAFYISILRRGN